MPRLAADIRISLKVRGGTTHRIELIRQPVGRRFWIRRHGKASTTMPEATATEIANRIRHCRRPPTREAGTTDHADGRG